MNYSDNILFLRKEDYREAHPVTQSGDFEVLGDTIIFWPVDKVEAYRFHYFGEELEKKEQRVGGVWQLTKEDFPLQPNNLPTEHGTVHPGEYIVHPHHGVGIFEYIVTRDSAELGFQTFLSLQYAGNDRLLFPFSRAKELMPYIGSRHPRLTRLYSKAWQNTKERVQKNLIGIARELLKIYASRQLSDRPRYIFNSEWHETLIRSSGFQLTQDQARALRDIRHDLEENKHPMDRLICGDVGFGKTEVAMQAAAQILQAGKQVAFIAPTTVLVEQHFQQLKKRFSELPVTIEHISRLTSNRDKEIREGLSSGRIDMIVGTHRLLGRDIQFKDLGLLIVDEEQKFGVAQKEYLKEMRPSVDVLALSATPIPRTLSMSLSGLRGLSLLRTAPNGRLAVKTEVEPYSDKILRTSLETEMKRGGQTYVVHNRVQSLPVVIRRVVEVLRKSGWSPQIYKNTVMLDTPLEGEKPCVIAMAHGQMSETVVAETMAAFMAGEIDILVASSIVEHGLDSPGANTLLVLHSEWFGLSDLYQLRGRVGRRTKQAHAYFLLGGIEREGYLLSPEALKVSETAKQRLAALQEADELGSGWSVAMRDLEIRGGGNILGHEQHGSMEAIGLLLYAQLLQEEIGRQARKLGIPLFQKTENQE